MPATRIQRLRAFVFHVTSLLAALLLAGVIVAWVHARQVVTTYDSTQNWIGDDGRQTNSSRFVVASGNGRIMLYRARFTSDEPRYHRHFEAALDAERNGGRPFSTIRHFGPPGPRILRIAGLGGDTYGFGFRIWSLIREHSSRTDYVAASVPHWAAAVVLAVLPAVWMIRWRARRRFPEGCCQGCGYDLRASPARCPECGRAVA